MESIQNAMKPPGGQCLYAIFLKWSSAYHRTLKAHISTMIALSDAKRTAKWSGDNVLLHNAKFLKCAIWSLFSHPTTTYRLDGVPAAPAKLERQGTPAVRGQRNNRYRTSRHYNAVTASRHRHSWCHTVYFGCVTCLKSFGRGWSFTARTLAGSALIPCSDTQYPKYSTAK